MLRITAIIFSLLLLFSCAEKRQEKKPVSANEAIPVKLLPIQSENSRQVINATGLLSTENEARLAFKIGGIIEQIYVKEGDKIKKGQLLATLKSTEIAAQVQQVQLAVEKADRDYNRANNLYRDSVATLEQLQNAKTGVDIARQNLQQARFNQQYAKIIAPADGFVVKKMANTGELANAGSPVLFVSGSSTQSKWILKLGLSDQNWSGVTVGSPAVVTIDAFPAKQFKGKLSKKALAADAVSGAFMVEVQVFFQDEQPAIGLFGNAAIEANNSSKGFSIGYDALLEANGKKGLVFVSDDGKTVQKVAVTISSIDNNLVYVADGLAGHKYIVSSGSPYLTENSVIAPVK
jgi:membrane fusion protein, multidrug efflux system